MLHLLNRITSISSAFQMLEERSHQTAFTQEMLRCRAESRVDTSLNSLLLNSSP